VHTFGVRNSLFVVEEQQEQDILKHHVSIIRLAYYCYLVYLCIGLFILWYCYGIYLCLSLVVFLAGSVLFLILHSSPEYGVCILA